MDIKIRASTVALLIVLVMVASLFIALQAGYHFDTIRSGSMEPAIGVGDLLISGPVDPESIEVGDVILYRSSGIIICHRVISVDHEGMSIKTKGDANPSADDDVPFSRITGKHIANIPYLGYVSSFLCSVYGVVSLAVTALAIYLVAGLLGRGDARKEGDGG